MKTSQEKFPVKKRGAKRSRYKGDLAIDVENLLNQRITNTRNNLVGRDEIKRSLPAKESRRLIHESKIARVFWMFFETKKRKDLTLPLKIGNKTIVFGGNRKSAHRLSHGLSRYGSRDASPDK